MKRKSIIIAVAVLTAILVIQMMFWVSCSQQDDDQDSLIARIAAVPFIAPEEVPTHEALEQLQKEAEEKLAQQQKLLPAEINGVDVIEDILHFARTSGVDALPISSVPVSEKEIEGRKYLVLRMAISAQGDLDDLIDFMDSLEDGSIRALAVDRAFVTQVEDLWQADIDVLLYARQDSIGESNDQGAQ